MKATIGLWQLEHDAEATRAAYARFAPKYQVCTCDTCRTFHEAGPRSLPKEFLGILSQLGIDMRYPVLIAENEPASAGKCSLAGVFHFIGSIEKGDIEHLSKIGDEFSFFIHPNIGPSTNTPFEKGPILGIEFTAKLPMGLKK